MAEAGWNVDGVVYGAVENDVIPLAERRRVGTDVDDEVDDLAGGALNVFGLARWKL